MNTTFAVLKRKLAKIEAFMDSEPLISAILVQDSNQSSQKANWDLVINLSPFKPVKGEGEIIIIIIMLY